MWFIFPQLVGLGQSPTAMKYSISGANEAIQYLAHPLLGPRLLECTQLVLEISDSPIERIFGHPDFLKFRSCMTLFRKISDNTDVFLSALDKYFGGQYDERTLRLLEKSTNWGQSKNKGEF